MTETRLQEIYTSVVHNAFYSVVGREKFLDSDITHEEMVELLKLACKEMPFVTKAI